MSDDSMWHFSGGSDEDAIMKILAQFGITPDEDGNVDAEQIMGHVQQLMTNFSTQMAGFGTSDPKSGMNWNFTLDIAKKELGAASHWQATTEQKQAILDATFVANMWLDEEISFDAIPALPQAWSKDEWLTGTFQTWQRLETPIVTSLATTLQDMFVNDEPNVALMAPMIRVAAAGVFSSQIGRALAQLAGDSLSATDVGLPLTSTPTIALLPTNIERFVADSDIPLGDVVLFFSLRESARQRLFHAVGWLAPQLLAMVEHYAREITIDRSALQQAVEEHMSDSIRLDLQEVGQTLANSMFKPTVTDEQREILVRLETLLALVEGWVDAVVAQVSKERMPNAAVLSEMVARRRVSANSAGSALQSLLGLELRPKRLREARTLWAATRSYRGEKQRDASWNHPDLMPTSDDLAEPLEYAQRGHQAPHHDDFDLAVAKLLNPDSQDSSEN